MRWFRRTEPEVVEGEDPAVAWSPTTWNDHKTEVSVVLTADGPIIQITEAVGRWDVRTKRNIPALVNFIATLETALEMAQLAEGAQDETENIPSELGGSTAAS